MASPAPQFATAQPPGSSKFQSLRFVIQSWFGHGKPYKPSRAFQKRLWHRVTRLEPQSEIVSGTERLVDASCTISYTVEVRYQLTEQYVIREFGVQGELPANIFKRFKAAIAGTIKKEFALFTAEKLLNTDDFLGAQHRVAEAITTLFENDEITCEADCRFQQPVIEWPKQDADPPGVITNQSFYEKVRKQNHDFFIRQESIRQDEAAARDNQKLEGEKKEALRQLQARLQARSRLEQENKDEETRLKLVSDEAKIKRDYEGGRSRRCSLLSGRNR